MYICQSIMDKCWNCYESHGEICVHCGCCSDNPEVRAKARIDVLERQIAEAETFDGWSDDPGLRALQEKNIKTDLKIFKNRLRYYKKRAEELNARG